MKTIQQVNDLSSAEFEKAYGDVAEHSPWVARNAAGDRPFVSRESMIRAFHEAIHSASETAQLALIGGGIAAVAPALVLPGLIVAGGAVAAVRWLPDVARAGAASLAAMSQKLQSLAGDNKASPTGE